MKDSDIDDSIFKGEIELVGGPWDGMLLVVFFPKDQNEIHFYKSSGGSDFCMFPEFHPERYPGHRFTKYCKSDRRIDDRVVFNYQGITTVVGKEE